MSPSGGGPFLLHFRYNYDFNWTESQIIIAVIGMVGLLSTGVVAVYSFRRNRTGNGRYQ